MNIIEVVKRISRVGAEQIPCLFRIILPLSTTGVNATRIKAIKQRTTSEMAASRVSRPNSLSTRTLHLQLRSSRVVGSQCRSFNLTTPIIESDSLPPDPPVQTPHQTAPPRITRHVPYPKARSISPSPPSALNRAYTSRYELSRAPTSPTTSQPKANATPQHSSITASSTTETQPLPPHLRTQLLHLATQLPHYIIIHIHGKPYLVTAGDTIRLPFLMHGVMPGDILRLDRASQLGSREWTLRAGAASPSTSQSPVGAQPPSRTPEASDLTAEAPIIGKTSDLHPSVTQTVPHPHTSTQLRHSRPKSANRPGYIDPSLFVCRATVLGTESEPLRIKEKTKRRQRHVKHVRSKHLYTILRVSEVSVRAGELDA